MSIKYGGAELWDSAVAGGFSGLARNSVLRQKDALKAKAKRANRAFICQDNAAILPDNLPGPGGISFYVLRGDFIYGDAIPALARATGPWVECYVTTLSLSESNLRRLVVCHDQGLIRGLTLIVSEFWIATDKAKVPARIPGMVDGRFRVAALRNHTKVILAKNDRGDWFVIEGSANLRSSNSTETAIAFNDREIYEFFKTSFDQMLGAAAIIA